MKNNPEREQLLQDWLAFARENPLYTKAGVDKDFAPHHTIGFLCQGSAEKYLKGYLVSRGWKLKKIHDLADLLMYASDYDGEFMSLLPLARILNQYIAEGRYPGDLPFEKIGEADAQEAIDAAEKIEQFVMRKLANLNSANQGDDRQQETE